MDFSIPVPTTMTEAHAQAKTLADEGKHLDAALRYLMVAGTIGATELDKAGVDDDVKQVFIAGMMLIGIEIKEAMAAQTRLN